MRGDDNLGLYSASGLEKMGNRGISPLLWSSLLRRTMVVMGGRIGRG